GNGNRAEISELTKDLDDGKYQIVINHQPTDYANETAAGVDLVLSGHTHGGQMFPIGLVSDLFGLNDMVYGHEKRGATNFIVTSGISDWAIDYKTGCFSEFVVIDVNGK
ncbi:MAG: serine/threonine protein phosphatase, partial [Clostridiales bacterium]|nr:serine/threonine protein phosphatase [Clostridiales bacterium]